MAAAAFCTYHIVAPQINYLGTQDKNKLLKSLSLELEKRKITLLSKGSTMCLLIGTQGY